MIALGWRRQEATRRWAIRRQTTPPGHWLKNLTKNDRLIRRIPHFQQNTPVGSDKNSWIATVGTPQMGWYGFLTYNEAILMIDPILPFVGCLFLLYWRAVFLLRGERESDELWGCWLHFPTMPYVRLPVRFWKFVFFTILDARPKFCASYRSCPCPSAWRIENAT